MHFLKLFLFEEDYSSNGVPTPQFIINKKTVAVGYGYSKKDEYINLLRSASSAGLEQVILTPSDFTDIIQNAITNNLSINKIDFNVELDADIQKYIESVLRSLNESHDKSSIDQIDEVLLELMEEFTYPTKVTFTNSLNKIIIHNNGIAGIETYDDIFKLNLLLDKQQEGLLQ
ncbi:hypothetical protein BSK49_24495 [Paenibacillus odorifer]|uniref:hypothetical protein n=1 Tax=Paenibacillus odorifer TaxID=189426 RepID=UPI00096E9DA4|nr:hypothetical protein [Paenibacillus odorifer]OMD83448.1 hypothetical protein BSK49_24495 [Paenibacillus odorifer]